MKFWKYIFGLLSLTILLMVIAIFQIPDSNFHIIACNVGQGDAILLTYKNVQILTDGGPDKSVMSCLGKYMPFWDRDIEMVISTHPDADHLTGLVEVIKNYKVEKILINPVDSGTQLYEALKKEAGNKGVTVINPVEGMRISVDLIYLDILNQTDELMNKLTVIKEGDKLSKFAISGKTNLFSVVYELKYKEFTALFLGDVPPTVSDSLSLNRSIGSVQYIKIPHHGSKNGITENLLKAVMPKLAVISVGKNPWGLPNKEVLDLLSNYTTKILRTDQLGNIEVVTDGEGYWIKK